MMHSHLMIRLTAAVFALGVLQGCALETEDSKGDALEFGDPDSPPVPLALGRFVPEREDDFAWENDKVAFRVYGPASRGQGPVSGVDAWFKKVNYPIIHKWYYQQLERDMSYHMDHGEGYDVYHVGSSRGVGGTAIWVEGAPYPASKFKEYQVLDTGGHMIRFTLRYEWMTPLGTVTEHKTISLALGDRLYRVDSAFRLNGEPASLPIAIGLTTHDEAAATFSNPEGGRVSTWEVIDGHGVGTGALLQAGWPREVLHLPSEEKDASHIWMITASNDSGSLTFHAGFAWAGDGEITSIDEWNVYLEGLAFVQNAGVGVSSLAQEQRATSGR